MKVIFLGTGTSQGVPVIGCTCEVCSSSDLRNKRLRTSVFVEVNGKNLVIDTGPDFRQQMLRERINRLDGVLFTHAHRDHTAGLDDVRAFNFMQRMKMPIYGTVETLNQIKSDFGYIFGPQQYPGLPRIELNIVDATPFEVEGVTVTPLPVLHHKMPVFGFRIGNFSYITDANAIPDSTMKKLQGTEVLVLTALQHEHHVSHFNLKEAVEMSSIIKPQKAYFTHISHKLGLHTAVETTLPENMNLAYDGLTLTLQA